MQIKFTLLALVLSGCATTTYAPPTPPVSKPEAAATAASPSGTSHTSVVFIRERAEPTAWNVSVLIDDKKMASIANKSFASFEVQPGKHSFKIDWPALAGQKDLKGDLELAPNETAYYLITAHFTYTGVASGAITYNTSVALLPLTQPEAEKILGEIRPK